VSRYTLKGSKSLDERIDADLKRIAEAVSPYSRAGILIGGYGRGEGTPFIHPDGSQSPFNDYDLVVVVDRLNRSIRGQLQMLEKQLSGETGLPVDLCPYPLSRLHTCEFSLLNYEMKYGHTVLWGADDILAPLPAYPHDAIPLPEGSRLLINRGKLLLDMLTRLASSEPLSAEERIRFRKYTVKLLLAFGDCALLAAGQYDISYAVKKMRFPAIGHCPERDYIVQGYRMAIDLKDWGDYRTPDGFDPAAECGKLRSVFVQFLPWYRSQYSGREGSVLKNTLLNLRWNRRLSAAHPRDRLYTLLMELLEGGDLRSSDRFYRLQRRFA
jgi:hypothetical protein